MNLLDRIFKFFASVRLAIVLLAILGVAFAVGTFMESNHGTPAAQMLIYRTPWMSVLLTLTALNLLASALDRMPWKKKHIGFLTTHLGIILILMGSLISHAFGIEGQLIIPEGKTESRMTVEEPVLELISVQSNLRAAYPFKTAPFPWTGRKELKANNSPLNVFLLANYPKAKIVEEVKAAGEGSPAIHFKLKGSMAENEGWLFLDDPTRSEMNLGPAVIRFSKEPMKPNKEKKKISEMGVLHFHFESGPEVHIDLSERSIDKPISLKGTPYEIKINRILRDAIVEGNKLIDRSQDWRNPAVELVLKGQGIEEKHTIFAQFPEFPTVHGMNPSEAHVRIAYEMEGFSEPSADRELRFVWQASGLPRYQIKKGEEIKEGEVELGKEIETGWMDFKFTIDNFFEKASFTKRYEPLPSTSQSTEALPVIQVELVKNSENKILWLPQGEMTHAQLGGNDYHMMYGLKTIPVGFQVELKDFMIDTDPGTDRPASFKSQVILKDAGAGIKREQLIQMNEPLVHRGYKVFQSAYQQTPGQPDISIFTVAKDPGNPLKFSGAIIMIGGIILLFYVKPFSTLKGSDPKLRSK